LCERMMNLFDILQKEHELVADAPVRYGDVFEHTRSILDYFAECFFPTDKKAHVSFLFIVQVQKSLYLAMLSALRHHRSQMFHMLRDALEAEVLACYALANPDYEIFRDISDDALIPKEALKNGGYDWFSKEYQEYSTQIKKYKKPINDYFSHANLFGAAQNLVNDDELQNTFPYFFDSVVKNEVEGNLWMIGDMAIGFMKIYATVLQRYSLVGGCRLFSESIQTLSMRNEKIKERLEKEVDPEIMRGSRERIK